MRTDLGVHASIGGACVNPLGGLIIPPPVGGGYALAILIAARTHVIVSEIKEPVRTLSVGQMVKDVGGDVSHDGWHPVGPRRDGRRRWARCEVISAICHLDSPPL